MQEENDHYRRAKEAIRIVEIEEHSKQVDPLIQLNLPFSCLLEVFCAISTAKMSTEKWMNAALARKELPDEHLRCRLDAIRTAFEEICKVVRSQSGPTESGAGGSHA